MAINGTVIIINLFVVALVCCAKSRPGKYLFHVDVLHHCIRDTNTMLLIIYYMSHYT